MCRKMWRTQMSRKIDTAIKTFLEKQQSARVADVTSHVEAVTGMSVGPANRKAHEFYQRRLQRHLHVAAAHRKKLEAAAKKAAKAKAGPTPTPKNGTKAIPMAKTGAATVKAKANTRAGTRKANTHANVGFSMPLQRRRALAKNFAQPPFTIIQSTTQWREIQCMHLADLESERFKVYWQK